MAQGKVIALLSFLLAVARTCQAETRPNVVFILADDYGYNDIGYHGSEIETPTLDKLAAEGLKLENYYVQPICTPTRSQLMSGRYQIHTGLQHGIIWPEQPNALPLNSPTLADKMKESGYATHMVGKWHLGFYKEEYLPWKRGFDSYFGYLTGSEDYYTHMKRYKDGKEYLDLHTENGPVANETGHYSAHLFTQKAIDVVNSYSGTKPFFLYLAYQSVHQPLQVPDQYVQKYKHINDKNRRIYAGMVSAMDEGVYNLTQALQQKGLWDNTLVIFSTDNGGRNSEGGNNFPLRGQKGTLWDGGMHGNGFVTGGALSPSQRGKASHELIHVSDWFPTLVGGVANGHFNGCLPLDGYNQWDTINLGIQSDREVLLHNIDPLYPRFGPSRHPSGAPWDTSVRAALRSGSYKIITGDPGPGHWVPAPNATNSNLYFQPEDKPDKNVWLFNITADPTEHHDLSDERPQVVAVMLNLLSKINATAVPVRYPPYDPLSNPGLHGGVWGPWE